MRPSEALPVVAANVPAALAAVNNWVGWRWAWRYGKWTKEPVEVGSGRRASTTDPATWTTFEAAVAYARKYRLPGVGFVFTDSLFAGVDLDRCRDPETGETEPWAQETVIEMDSYAEVSPTATGVKVFVRGSLPPGRRRKGQVEMYDTGRFFTVTGHRLPGMPTGVTERTEQLAALHRRVFGPAEGASRRYDDHHHDHHRGGPALDDAELVRRAMAAANGDKFARLWAGDTTGYGSASEADLALCSMLGFWAGPDEARIDALFRKSGLVREKWSRPDYRSRTIAAALAGRTEFWPAERTGKVYARRRGVVSVG